MIRFVLAVSIALLMCVSTFAQTDEPTLKTGSDAPLLTPAKWVKGGEVKAFEKDKIYVVEFWATWCGPCKESIPHLTELAKKYKDVTFIGQSVWEQDQSKVEPFVKEMGEKMDYHVAMDDMTGGEPGKMATAWMAAAGRDGIPTAFIVDKESKIAWIGHPMEMEAVLDKIVKGTFDVKAEDDKATQIQSIQDKLNAALQNKDWDAAFSALDRLEKLDNTKAPQIDFVRFNLLLQKRETENAFKLAARIVENQKTNAEGLNAIAWTMVDPENPVEITDNYALAEKAALLAVEASKGERADILDTLARVYFLEKKLDKAIETQAKAVEKATDDELKQDLQKTLNEYQKPR